MLSVDIPAPVAIQLLAGHLGEEVAGLLAKVPNGLRLDQASAEDVGPGSPADQLWYRLKAEDKMGRTRTGKLLARKRPLLLPIYDDVIRCYLGAPPGDWWEPLRRELQRDNGHLTKALQALHARAGLPAGVGLLRTLDVVLWRKHQVDHRAGNHPPKVRD